MAERIVAEVEIAAPVERVWRALREPDELRRWFGWDYDGLDAEIEQVFFQYATADEAEAVVDTGDGRLALSPAGEGVTRLRVTRTAAPADPDPVDDGWLQFAHQLRFALERHPGENRVAERIDRPQPLPAGQDWFSAREDLFGIVVQDAAALLAVEGAKATLSRYASAGGR